MEEVDFAILAATSVLGDLIEKCPPAKYLRDAFQRMSKTTIEKCLSTTRFGFSTSNSSNEATYPTPEINPAYSSRKKHSFVEEADSHQKHRLEADERLQCPRQYPPLDRIVQEFDYNDPRVEPISKVHPRCKTRTSPGQVGEGSLAQKSSSNLCSQPQFPQEGELRSSLHTRANKFSVQAQDSEMAFEGLDFLADVPGGTDIIDGTIRPEDMHGWPGDHDNCDVGNFDLFDGFFFGSK